jgi:quinol-cytochrome oxidoreductase complex cytochrome b subunit/mono/diheme cytochrome c family protein
LFKHLSHWFDTRTGYKDLIHHALEEPIPGGAKWRYVFGSALSATFMIQLVTGLFLMISYSPSATTAWGSVYYISYQMGGGWFLRGIHHFGSQAMVVLLAMHLLQVLIAGAYRAPREVNWWFGMALLFITLGFSLTGYLLPWDQKGYWATKVATNISSGAPVLGPYIQKVVVGGPDYGNQTLTRFYGLHVGVLPALLVMCLAAHIALFRKHGVTPPKKAVGVEMFWPKQVAFDVLAGLAVFGILVLLVVSEGGANLDAPADPSSDDYPARPEWYFLSLFQMLKLFEGDREIIGTIIIPTVIMVVLMLLPLLDKFLPRGFAHFAACTFVIALLGGAGFLTYKAWQADASDTVYVKGREKADQARNRALQLAGEGIPPEGAAYLLGRDPLYHGGKVFEKKCQGCHAIGGQVIGEQSAPDLKEYGSRAWIRGLLEKPTAPEYFGKVPACDGMKTWKESSKLTAKELDEVADYVATFAQIDAETSPSEWAAETKGKEHPGRKSFQKECVDCHTMGDLTERDKKTQPAPDLFGWGSTRWITRMIKNPNAPAFYGHLEAEQKMPAFGEQLTDNDITTLVRYLKGDYLPVGAAPAESKAASKP